MKYLARTLHGIQNLQRLFVSGRVHDKKIADEQALILSFVLWQDTGFIGHNPENVPSKCRQGNPKGKTCPKSGKGKTEKSPLSELHSNTPLAVSNAAVFSGSVSDVINTVSMIRLCRSPAVCTTSVSLLKKAL
jgi:hypothetical protein